MGKIIGIDLGTTNSVVAIMEGDSPQVIINEEGGRTTPSVVFFNKDGERLIGATARRRAAMNPKATVASIKRFMGQRWAEAEAERGRVSYPVVKIEDQPRVDVGEKEPMSAPEISAVILQKLKRDAEKYLGEAVTDAVITVPAYFNDAQRQATRDAGRIAGLNVQRIINEPTAAALAYGLGRSNSVNPNDKKDQIIAVYDFGGGTFDVSILEISSGIVEVRSTNGDTHLGGDDVDNALVDWLIKEFKNDNGETDIASNPMTVHRIREAAEKAKMDLSASLTTTISIPFLCSSPSGPLHLERTLSRARFEQMIEAIIERTILPCQRAMRDAGILPANIDEVLLVGGSTRIPLVQEKVKKLFGREPNRSVNPDEVVGLGAAVQAGMIAGDVTKMMLLDVTPLTLGIETAGGLISPLILRNTSLPVNKTEVYSTAADNQTAVDINVYQGERPMVQGNRLLGTFRLDGIPPVPRGVPQIEVTFDLDANGILSVSARDTQSGRTQKITITSSSGLTKEDVDKLVAAAAVTAEADKLRRDIVEARNILDNLIYNSDKMLREHGEKMPPALKQELAEALDAAKLALDTDDLQQLQDAAKRIHTAGAESDATGGAGAEAGG